MISQISNASTVIECLRLLRSVNGSAQAWFQDHRLNRASRHLGANRFRRWLDGAALQSQFAKKAYGPFLHVEKRLFRIGPVAPLRSIPRYVHTGTGACHLLDIAACVM